MTNCKLTFFSDSRCVENQTHYFPSNSQPFSLPSLLYFFKQVLAYVYEYSGVLPVCVCGVHVHHLCTQRDQKRALGYLELELKMLMSYCVGAEK